MAPERLRIGFVAGALADGGGMARYARELMRALARRDDIELVIVAPEAAKDQWADLPPGALAQVVRFRGAGPIGRALWERYRLGHVLEGAGVDVVHGMKHLIPRTDLPTVLTVHDLMPITLPEQFGPVKRWLLPRQYLASMRSADVLVCDSQATADRLEAIDQHLSPKVVVAHLGVAPHLRTVRAQRPAAAPAGSFALVVGDLSPRKNLGFLLDLWPEVERRTEGLRLLAVGPEGWRSKGTRARLDGLAAGGHVVWAAHVSDGELRWCYENAAVVLMPALEEGFGLPVIEALALGAPVIASTDAALVEAGAGRSRHIDVSDASAWIDAIAAVALERPAPVDDLELTTWDSCADTTVTAYRSAIEQDRR